MQKAIRLRKRLNSWFLRGSYVDDEGIISVDDGCEVAQWQINDGSSLYIAINLRGYQMYFLTATICKN